MIYDSIAMILIDAQLTASEVLRAFHHDEPYLFLGAAFTTVGFVSVAFCVLRRRFDALLVWMAIFAILYGQRLWLDADLLRISIPDGEFMDRLRSVVSFSIPIPAFIFFRVAGFLGYRSKALTFALCAPFLILAGATCIFGPLPQFSLVNNVLIVVALLSILVRSLRRGSVDRNFVVIRRGLLCFVALAMWNNTGAYLMPVYFNVEPYGFAVLLGCLGYVAARRTLERDVELGEIHKELELARRIQLSILPGAFPESTDFRVAARYVPMTSVAGDLYDFLVTGDRQAGLLIADVSGHGVPAALIASMVKMAATSQRGNSAHPAQLLAGMNAALCGNTQGQFVTAACVHLDAVTCELRYSAAGHPPMLLLRDGTVTKIAENGLILAAFDFATYSDMTLPLEPGDRLLLYTDGLIEATNAQGEFFGEESLNVALGKTAKVSAAEAVDQIIACVEQWAKSQEDDLTVLVCDYLRAG
jgi:sigma-B regulation protein RsbU (phosphoserine phosphatase)